MGTRSPLATGAAFTPGAAPAALPKRPQYENFWPSESTRKIIQARSSRRRAPGGGAPGAPGGAPGAPDAPGGGAATRRGGGTSAPIPAPHAPQNYQLRKQYANIRKQNHQLRKHAS